MAERTVRELREAAERVLPRCNLGEVVTSEVSFRGRPIGSTPQMEVFTEFYMCGRQDDAGDVEVWARYRTFATPLDETDDAVPPSERPEIWSVQVECIAQFEAENDEDELIRLSQEDLSAFAVFVGAPILHPYVREVTQSVTARSAFPAFTIGLLTPLGSFDDEFKLEMDSLLYDPFEA